MTVRHSGLLKFEAQLVQMAHFYLLIRSVLVYRAQKRISFQDNIAWRSIFKEKCNEWLARTSIMVLSKT